MTASNQDQVASLINPFENQLNLLTEQVRIKDEQLAAKNEQLADKDEQLAAKDEQLLAKDKQLANKNEQLAAKDEQLAYKDEELAYKDDQLATKDEQLAAKNEQLAYKDEQLAAQEKLNMKLQEENSGMYEKVAVMTDKDETKHVFQLYINRNDPNNYRFIRPQSRYLKRAEENPNLEKYELLHEQNNVPNAMNILNRLKEKLADQGIQYTASHNELTVHANVLEMVKEILPEPRK